MNILIRFATLVLIIFTTACASSGSTGTQVTRVHLDTPIEPQSFAVQLAVPDQATTQFGKKQLAIVAGQLTGLGFTEAPADEATMLAIVTVTTDNEIKPPQRSPFSIGIGGGSFGSSGGVGVGADIPVGGGSDGEIIEVMTLSVDLSDQESKDTIWEGTAKRTVGPDTLDPARTVETLAQAMFQEFPGKSGQTVTVSDPQPASDD